ncbi:AAA family ATPase [Evansella sp. AB-P1]|uniref:AAA family ATPase n=1 Tax=Evansella sp. AB-P1 TaxID=3037653 RepID=UPI00241C4BCE|nr:AAA family ATPase [Evansella sp. AB-P1]MDG5790133.1 AAA family ATPase [Evansella sp. AB-P1]
MKRLASRIDWLKNKLLQFKESEVYQLQVRVRNYRANQLRELLADPEMVTLEMFNEEVWTIGHAFIDNKKIGIFHEESLLEHKLEVETQLREKRLVYKGNSIWGTGARIFGASLNISDEEKTDLIRKALYILNDKAKTPEEKAEQIQEIKGFGVNIATGLVMVFHPKEFAIYNESAKQSAKLLGIGDDISSYQSEMRQILGNLDVRDFVELDYLIYRLNDLQEQANEKLGPTLNEIFLHQDEADFSFELMKFVCDSLEVTSENDERVALTITKRNKNQTVLHYNFCDWLIVGFYPGGKVRIPLIEEEASDLPVVDVFQFSQGTNETKVNCYSMSLYELDENVMQHVSHALEIVRERFATHQKTRFRSHHVAQLAEAVFNQEKKTQLLHQGINKESLASDINYWIFQGNPNVFDVSTYLKEAGEKTWSVSAHKTKIKPGDKAIIWVTGSEAGVYGLATVKSEPYQRADMDVDIEYGCEIDIDMVLVDDPISNEEIKEHPQLQKLKAGNQGTNFSATVDEFEVIYQMAMEKEDKVTDRPTKISEKMTLAELCEKTGIEEVQMSRWLRSIERKKQAIIYGPPGTGKTFVGQEVAKYLVSGSDGFVELVQFHPSYSYEDFIQGIRPKVEENETLSYVMEPGRFMDFCHKARTKDGMCVLIIDEINRANLSRVFGELMYLLEYRDQEIPLAGGETRFRIPNNVRIIGTMNTADRSIALMDHAFRRRFAFLDLPPNYDVLVKYQGEQGKDVSNLISVLKDINHEIADRNYALGISFFLVDDIKNELEDIWRMEIEPYLEEYFFDQPDKVTPFKWENVNLRIGLTQQ